MNVKHRIGWAKVVHISIATVNPSLLRPHDVTVHNSFSSIHLVTVTGLGVGVARVVLELGG